jgi:hypothetical protein
MHPRLSARTCGVDSPDQSVGDVAAQDHGMQRAISRKVADKLTAPAQQPQILDALDRPANKGVAFPRLIHSAGASIRVDKVDVQLHRRERAIDFTRLDTSSPGLMQLQLPAALKMQTA